MKTHCVLFQETVYFTVLQSHGLYVPHLTNKPHINLIYDSGLHLFSEKKNSPAAWHVHTPPPKSQDPRMVWS